MPTTCAPSPSGDEIFTASFTTEPEGSGMHVKGFALAASKIVPAGGVGRMLEFARANLRNAPLVGNLAPA